MFQDLLTNYIDLFSLAQGNAGTHQECKWQEDLFLRFPELRFCGCGKRGAGFWPSLQAKLM
jgi:hypothetical protein